MKKLMAALMALVLMCSFFCVAEAPLSMEQQAKDVISMVNYFAKENIGVEQLFVGFQEMAEGQVFGFYTEDNTLQALLVGDVETNSIDNCSFICDDPMVMDTALNYAIVLPFVQLLLGDDESVMDALQTDMIAMAAWFDGNRVEALEAFENNVLYGVSYQESEFFHLDLMIVPMDEGSRLMATYYFYPAEAE